MPTRFVTPSDAYDVVQTLREGPSGSTHVVRRESDGLQLILKALTIGKMGDWKEFDLFEREVAALRAIDHPRIPRWIDSHLDEANGLFVHVQTLVPGTSLRELMASRGSISAQEAEYYLRQCLEILDYLHSRSPPLVHRDLKPSNIMLAGSDIHLVDFGAVKIGRRESTSMTTVGTFGFMAPEQIFGRAEPRSDLYGLGMTFVTLATGLQPSDLPQDPNTGQIDPRPVLGVPPHLARVLLALIRPGLNERPPSARDALVMLSQPAPLPQPPPQMSLMARAMVQHPVVSPYEHPEGLSEPDKHYLRRHTLQAFPVWAAMLLHYMTFGIFSIVHFGAQHDRFPKAMQSDPSAAKGIGFNFIPYVNLYWGVFNPMRLTDRLNLQYRIRGRENGVPRGLMLACSILGIIPYLNILIGIPFWGVGVYKLQKAINELAKTREAPVMLPPGSVPLALPPNPNPNPNQSGW